MHRTTRRDYFQLKKRVFRRSIFFPRVLCKAMVCSYNAVTYSECCAAPEFFLAAGAADACLLRRTSLSFLVKRIFIFRMYLIVCMHLLLALPTLFSARGSMHFSTRLFLLSFLTFVAFPPLLPLRKRGYARVRKTHLTSMYGRRDSLGRELRYKTKPKKRKNTFRKGRMSVVSYLSPLAVTSVTSPWIRHPAHPCYAVTTECPVSQTFPTCVHVS
jgi:hypothetical protein